MKTKLFILFCLFAHHTYSQNSYRAIIKDKTTNEIIIGAIAQLKNSTNGVASDEKGELVLNNIPDSIQVIEISFIGYTTFYDTLYFPSNEQHVIILEPLANEIEEIIVEGTRSNKSIEDIPTLVEVLTEEFD